MRLALLILAAAIFCAPSHAQDSAPLITRQEALSRPIPEVADIVLRQIADRIREIVRPTFYGIAVPDRRLRYLAFATQPYASSEGICGATVLIVGFSSDAPPSEDGTEIPVRADHFRTRVFYKVIGETDTGLDHFPPAARDELNRRCQGVSPVIASETADRDQRAFFEYEGEIGLRMAVGVLRTVMSDGVAGRLAELRCSANAQYCGDPRAELRSVTLDDLARIEIKPDPSNPRSFQMRAQFHAPRIFTGQTLFLTAVFELDRVEFPTRLVRVVSAEVMRGVIMYD